MNTLRLALAIAALVFLFALPPAVERWVETPSTTHYPPSTHLTVDLRDCTPAHITVTPEVTFTMRRLPGDQLAVLGCTRYAWPMPSAQILAAAKGER